jgi:5-methylcytosine-specific restriction endonuclease McrA
MKYIDKNQDVSQQSRGHLENWLASDAGKKVYRQLNNNEIIPSDVWNSFRKSNDPRIPKDVWDSFGSGTKPKIYQFIRYRLVKEQGGICCYCGQRLLNNNSDTRIEHLKPKSLKDENGTWQYKHIMLDYNNLLASCYGGEKEIVHRVEDVPSTIESIATKYGISVSQIESLYADEDTLEEVSAICDLYNLKEGDTVLIYPKRPKVFQHCDARKGEHEISVTPLQIDCTSQFKYQQSTGKVVGLTDKAQDTIEVLGLNSNKELMSRRKDIIASTKKTRDLLKNALRDNIEALRQKIDQYKSNVMALDQDGLYQPYCFVAYAVLEGQLEL